VDEDLALAHWAYGGGFLYWMRGASPDYPVAYLKRKAENGAAVQPLLSSPSANLQNSLVADDDGVFFVRGDDLKARLTSDAETESKIADLASATAGSVLLAAGDDYVYYNQPDGIHRASKFGYGSGRVSDAAGITGLAVDGTYVYWLDSGGLWQSDKSCTTPACWGSPQNLSTHGGQTLTVSPRAYIGRDVLTWVEEGTHTWNIRYRVSGLSAVYLAYSSPRTTTTWVGRVVCHDGQLFWLERHVGPVHWLRRRPLTGGSVDNIDELYFPHMDYLTVTATGVIYADDNGIYRIEHDASPVEKDLALDAWEVTQGIQNLHNDVPLVAGKTTYVRVYGSLAGGTRPANGVEVSLSGSRGGASLSGSPLSALEPFQSLSVGTTWDRASFRRDGWLFLLPESWTQAGYVTLRAQINPRGVYPDDNSENDTLSTVAPLRFYRRPVLCLDFHPVRTHAGTQTMDHPYFNQIIDLTTRLMPFPNFRLYSTPSRVEEREFRWKTLQWAYGPYEMEDDGWKVLASLGWRDTFTDDPDICEDNGAWGLTVGMVDPQARTDGVGGQAYTNGWAQSWVQFPSEWQPSWRPRNEWQYPERGSTLAHEMSHNLGRYHVNCPPGIDDVDMTYPYASTWRIDDRPLTEPTTHFGFNINTQLPISPVDAYDFMGYCRPSWVSDYTWKRLMYLYDAQGEGADPASESLWASQVPDLASADEAVMAMGVISPTVGGGLLASAWVFPTAKMGSSMLQKWQALASPKMDALSAPVPQYHLRLRNAKGVILDDRAITLIDDLDVPDTAGRSFSLAFPAPAGEVAKIELMIRNDVVHEITPGAAAPEVSILSPAGGEMIGDRLDIKWQASDDNHADFLLYTVQYSSDGGKTWKALATNLPGEPGSNAVSLPLTQLALWPAEAASARIRVAASDGYHTSFATSKPFAVANRPPRSYITWPAAEQEMEAGLPVVLRGGAVDAEEGNLGGSSLTSSIRWSLDGEEIGRGQQLVVDGLAPGTYEVSLRAQDSRGSTSTVSSSFRVRPLRVESQDDTLTLDGLCDEAAYAQGAVVPLQPYDDGSQAAMYVARTDSDLWACFTGLARTPGSTGVAGLMVDADNSAGSVAQPDDHGYFVREDGTPYSQGGDGLGGLVARTLYPPGGRVYIGENTWSAELRIEAADLGGWHALMAIGARHAFLDYLADGVSWPFDAEPVDPDDFGVGIFTALLEISELTPSEATAGQGETPLFVRGEGFVSNSFIVWNGIAKPTAYWSSDFLSTMLSAGDLAAPGIATVEVRNPDVGPYLSNTVRFVIKSPVPAISSLSPSFRTAGGSAFALVVEGDGFVDGATVLWDGEARTTQFVSSTELRANIRSGDTAFEGEAGVVVRNPSPSEQMSNIVRFSVLTEEAEAFRLYQPLLLR